MGSFDNLPDYNPVLTSSSPGSGYLGAVDAQTQTAMRPQSDFQTDINQNVKDQSNLMGPSNQDDPLSSALSRRGEQVYGSAVNQAMRTSAFNATDRKTQLQTQDVENRAAVYQNTQTRAQQNFQQISYQREAAIVQEATRRQLYAQLFGGLGVIGGAMAAKGIYNARHAHPSETYNGTQGGAASGQFDPNATNTPQTYNSPNFGPIGGD